MKFITSLLLTTYTICTLTNNLKNSVLESISKMNTLSNSKYGTSY